MPPTLHAIVLPSVIDTLLGRGAKSAPPVLYLVVSAVWRDYFNVLSAGKFAAEPFFGASYVENTASPTDIDIRPYKRFQIKVI
jgi:hypothetical protein